MLNGIKEIRNKCKMTQSEFADELQIPKRCIENWEQGIREPPIYLVKLINYYAEHELRKRKELKMKTIKEMENHELRVFLGIESAVDILDGDEFDKWDSSHCGKDFYRATDRRNYLIKELVNRAFNDECDDEVEKIYQAVEDEEDAKILAEELVNFETYLPLWEYLSKDVTAPDDYDGIDAYVEAAQLEFSKNLFGGYADEEAVLKLFTNDK